MSAGNSIWGSMTTVKYVHVGERINFHLFPICNIIGKWSISSFYLERSHIPLTRYTKAINLKTSDNFMLLYFTLFYSIKKMTKGVDVIQWSVVMYVVYNFDYVLQWLIAWQMKTVAQGLISLGRAVISSSISSVF